MDDLDALLVDLQASASAHVKSQNSPMVRQKQFQQQQQYPTYHQDQIQSHHPQPQYQVHLQQQTHDLLQQQQQQQQQQQRNLNHHHHHHRHQFGGTPPSRNSVNRDSLNEDSPTPPPPPPPPLLPHQQLEEVVQDLQPDYANGCYVVEDAAVAAAAEEDAQPVYEEQQQQQQQQPGGGGRPQYTFQPPPPPPPPPPQQQQQQQQQHHQHPQVHLPPPPPVSCLPATTSRQSSTGLGHNLSELDSLLESLNSAQFMAEVEKKNLALSQKSSPPPPANVLKAPEPKASSAASSATKDLDDLMASLSGFHTTPTGDCLPPIAATAAAASPPEKPARQLGSRQNSPPVENGTGIDNVGSGVGKEDREMFRKSPSREREKSGSPTPTTTTTTSYKISPNQHQQQQRDDDNVRTMTATPPPPKPTKLAAATAIPSSFSSTLSSSSPPVATSGVALDSMLNQLGEEARKQGVNTTPKGHCRTCNKMIMGQVVTAMGNTYHPEHFICTHCQKELGTETFFERDDNPFCEECCHFLFSPKCAYCSGPITGKCMSALDKTWHPEHFFCAHCGIQFGEEEFHEKNQKVFCRRCFFDIFAARCKACNLPITANYVSALEGQWHNECFSCRECLMPFTGGSYFEHDGQPYCEVHYHARRGSLCAGCQKPITGRCITAMGKKFHPEHFVCSFCLKQLNKGTFKEKTEKPYCHACFGKLFG